MDSTLKEILDIAVRWIHLIAGIMWVGNSMLFNWLDRNLVPKEGMDGEIWLVHSGGFYQIEKKQLEPHQMPKILHWFKWQSYTTWMSGICLLILVYYMGGGLLVDPSVSKIGHGTGVAIGLGSIALSFLTYDILWRSPLRKSPSLLTAICFALLGGVLLFLTKFLSGRAAYIHLGVLMGTIMAGNVFFHIIPSQHHLVDATKAGKPQDPSVGKWAKERSIHNNYMTFPVLFIMISNHFPATYGSAKNYLILAVLVVSGASIRHFMNIRFWFKPWKVGLFGTIGAALTILVILMSRGSARSAPPGAGAQAKIPFSTVRNVIRERCSQCHSATPTDEVWKVAPANVMFDTPDQVKMFAERIKVRAVIGKTMPLANKTNMTDDERELLSKWLYAGASIDE